MTSQAMPFESRYYVWRTPNATGVPVQLSSGVVPFPGLEAPLFTPTATSGNAHGDTTLTSQPSSASQVAGSRVPPPLTYPWLPYYDPTRYRPSTAMHTSDSHASDPLLAALTALQSQFTTLQENVKECFVQVNVDVKDALSQLQTLRTAQTRTAKSIADLEGAVGMGTTGIGSRGHGRRAKRGGSVATVESHGSGGETGDKTLVERLTGIQNAIDELRRRNPSVETPAVPPGPLRSVLNPPPTRVPSAGPGRADASVQAAPPSPTSESSSSLSRNGPGFSLVNWSADPAIAQQFYINSAHASPYTTESLTNVFGSQFQNSTRATAHSQDPTYTGGRSGSSTQLPAIYTPSLPSHQNEPPVTSSNLMTDSDEPAQTTSSSTQPAPSTSVPPRSTPSGTPVVSEINTNDNSVMDAEKTLGPAFTRTVGDTQDVIPSLPTTSADPARMSMTYQKPHLVEERESHTMRGVTDAPTPHVQAYVCRTLPMIPTPPCLTSELSGQEESGPDAGSLRGGSWNTLFGSLSPLTPSAPSPPLSAGKSFSGQTVVEGVGSMDNVVMNKEQGSDVQNDTAGTRELSCSMATVYASQLTRVPAQVSPLASLAPGDINQSVMPCAPAEHPDVEPWPHSGNQNENNGKNVSTEPGPCYTDGSSLTSLSASPTWSIDLPPCPPHPISSISLLSSVSFHRACGTPSDAVESRPTPDEDEVFHALVLGASGTSTPMQNGDVDEGKSSPLIWSRARSRKVSVHPESGPEPERSDASSYLEGVTIVDAELTSTSGLVLAVDPSMLLAPTPTEGSGSVSQALELGLDTTGWHRECEIRSLSPLTPQSADAERDSFVGGRGEARKGVSTEESASAPPQRNRSTSRSSGICTTGGPGATLDELAMLARRKPLKIHLKLPERVKPLKRKREIDDGDRDASEQVEEQRNDTGGRNRTGATSVGRQARREVESGVVSIDVVPSRTSAVPSTPIPTSNLPLTAPARATNGTVEILDMPVARKKAKRHGNGNKKVDDAARNHEYKKAKPGPSPGKSILPVKHYLRNGEFVTVPQEHRRRPSSRSRPRPASSSRAQEGAVRDLWTLPRAGSKGQDDQTTNTSLSSLAGKPMSISRPSSRKTVLKTSPTKQDVVPRGKAKWPERLRLLTHWDAQFIQCDSCDAWYHYGCVGIKSGDPRLKPETAFQCPTCNAQQPKHPIPGIYDDTCARPDCPEPQVKDNTGLYFVEKLVGRKKVEGYVYMWLAKWEGYPMSDSTWIPRENVVGDGSRLFDAFLEDALREDADFTQDVVLLKEAVDAGWIG